MTNEQDQTPKDNPSILDLAERLAASCREMGERIEKVQELLDKKKKVEEQAAEIKKLHAHYRGLLLEGDEERTAMKERIAYFTWLLRPIDNLIPNHVLETMTPLEKTVAATRLKAGFCAYCGELHPTVGWLSCENCIEREPEEGPQ